MSRHIALWNLGSKEDTVRVYTEETTVLTIFEREDLHIFKGLPGAKKPGIYILLSETRRYVGQSSGSVWSRLNDHDKKKDWWDKVVVFSREDGLLDKLQLDRLESWLIEKFENLGYSGDNKTLGKDTYISAIQRGKALTLLETVESILLNDANLNIFKRKPRVPRKTDVDEDKFIFLIDPPSGKEATDADKETIADSKEGLENVTGLAISKIVLTSKLYGSMESRYFRGIYSEYLKKVWVDFKKEIIRSLSNPRGVIKTASISPFREQYCFRLDETYSFYNSFSRMMIESRLQEISDFIEDEIEVEVIYQKGLF